MDEIAKAVSWVQGWVTANFYRRTWFARVSRGAPDAHRPVLLNETGKLDNTFLNMGAGSLLDADLLDGIDSAGFVAAASYTAADVLAKLLTVDGTGTLLDADKLDGNEAAAFSGTAHTHSAMSAADILTAIKTVDGTGTGLDADLLDGAHGAAYVAWTDYENTDVLAKVKAVDGTGSGLDADLLDGKEAAAFALLTGATFTGDIIAPSLSCTDFSANGTEATPNWDKVLFEGGTRQSAISFGNSFNASHGTYIKFSINNRVTESTPLDAMVINGYGYVGIVTETPTSLLFVGDAFSTSSGGVDRVITVATKGGGTGRSVLELLVYTGDYGSRIVDTDVVAEGTGLHLQIRNGGANYDAITISRATRNVGIGVTAPQGPLHVHNGTGGFGFFTKTAIGTTAQVIIPDGTGDVTRAVTFDAVFYDSAGTAVGVQNTILNNASAAFTVGTSQYTLAVSAAGAFTVSRNSGTGTATLAISCTWL